MIGKWTKNVSMYRNSLRSPLRTSGFFFLWRSRAVCARGRDQKLNRLMKSWGERAVAQLSGLLAVQGWFVSWQRHKDRVRRPFLCSGLEARQRAKERERDRERYLPEKDVAVRAEVQGVAVLLSVRIAAAQLEVHSLPLQVTFLRHHQALADLKTRNKDF